MFFHIAPRDAVLVDPQERLMLKILWELLEDAGYTRHTLHQQGRTGLFIGSMYDHYPMRADNSEIQYAGGRRWETVNRCSFFYNFKGPSVAVDCACSTALASIHMACRSILDGDCETAVAGAVNLTLHPIKYQFLRKLGMLEQDSRSHSLGRGTGYMPCEGAGAVLLKPLEKALEDKDNIYAVIHGTGVNHGGITEGFTVPSGEAERKLILDTLKKSGITIRDIDYYELSTTGCQVGDKIEIDTVCELFKEYGNPEKKCRVGSVKTNLGHLEAASGMSQFTKTALQLKYNMLVPSINVEDLYDVQMKKGNLIIQDTLEPWDLSEQEGVTAINSFGAGGSNAFCVLSAVHEKKEKESPKEEYLCVLSSYKVKSLEMLVHKMIDYLTGIVNGVENQEFSMNRLEYTLQVGREQMPKRLAVLCRNETELLDILKEFEHENRDRVLYRELTEDECQQYRERDVFIGISQQELAQMWVNGKNVRWEDLHHTKRRKISLPVISFTESRYWPSKAPAEEKKKPLEKKEKKLCRKKIVLSKIGSYIEKSSLGVIKEQVKNILIELLKCKKEEIADKMEWKELGMDSVLAVKFAEAIAKQFGLDFKVMKLYDCYSVKMLSEFIWKQRGAWKQQKRKIELLQKSLSDEKETDAKENEVTYDESENNLFAIVGMAGRFPRALTVQEFWNNLKEGKDCVTEIPAERWDYKDYYNESGIEKNKSYCKTGGFIERKDEFDYGFFDLTYAEARSMNPEQRILLEEVWHAFEDAGINEEARDGSQCGVFIGAGKSDYSCMNTMYSKELNAFSLIGESSSMTAGRISYSMNLKGPAITVDTACSSSLTALHLACNSMKNGECEIAVAAGVCIMNTPSIYIMGAQGEMLSKTGKCKAFHNEADGFVPAEGVAVLILKPLSAARKDHNKIYSIIEGTAVNEDGHTNGITAPSGQSQTELESSLYEKIGLNPEKIGYVEAHGTGTKLGDPIEVEALTNAYRKFTDKKQFCAIGSAKSNMGHGMYSAGLIGVIKASLCLYYKTLVPTINVEEENKFIDFEQSPFYVNKVLKKWECKENRRATVSSFGFSGTNVHVVLKENDMSGKRQEVEDKDRIAVFSGKTKEALRQNMKEFVAWLEENSDAYTMADISYTLTVGRSHFQNRKAFIVDGKQALLTEIKNYLSGGDVKEKEEGAVSKELAEYVKNYLAGEKVHWEHLFEHEVRKIANIPGYSFERVEFPYKVQHTGEQEEAKTKKQTTERKSKEVEEKALYQSVEQHLSEIFASVIGVKKMELQPKETFRQEEFSSLVIREIINELSENFGKLSVSLLYEYTTLEQLTGYFINKHKEACQALHYDNRKSVPEEEMASEEKSVETVTKNIEKKREHTGQPEIRELLIKKVWKETTLFNTDKKQKKILAVGCSQEIESYLQEQVKDCVTVQLDLLDAAGLDGYMRAFVPMYFVPDEIILCIGIGEEALDEIHKVFNFTKSVIQYLHTEPLLLKCFFDADKPTTVHLRALSAFLKTVCAEEKSFTACLIENEGISNARLAEMLLLEDGSQFEVKYCENGRKVAYSVELTEQGADRKVIRKDGIYLIIGGMGGLGRKLLLHLAKDTYASFILTGRSNEKEQEMQKLREQLGGLASVEYYQADITEEQNVQELMWYIEKKYGRLNGIFHLAGVSKDRLFVNTEWDDFIEVIKPKTDGTMLLKKYAEKFYMDFSVLFSSIAGYMGNIGQCAYAYGNCFEENYALEMKNDAIYSIQWSLWEEGGMNLTQEQKEYYYEENGTSSLPNEKGFSILDRLLTSDVQCTAVLYGDVGRLKENVKNPDMLTEENASFVEMEENMDIAIVGIDGVYPKAHNLDELWKNLMDGKDCISMIPADRWDNNRFYSQDRKDETKYYCQYGGFIDDVDKFDSLFFGIAPKDAVYINPQERIMLQVVWHVLEDAGYTRERLQGEKVGVYMGLTNSDYKFNGFNRGLDQIKPIADPCASVANMISYVLDLNGPSMSIDTMCSSSLTALYVAIQALKTGECNTAIVGGANLCMHPQKYMTLCKEGMLSPEGRCKSFGADSDGYVPGEGIGAVMIKPLNKAVKDGDSIYAVIKSCCINHGGKTSGYTVPSPNAQADVISEAIKKAGIAARTISYIETHGTGTALGDPIEITGLSKAFCQYTEEKQFCSIGSIKSNIGHLEGAAGIASLTKAVLQLKHKKLVPSLFSSRTNSDIDFENTPFYVQQTVEEWNPVMQLADGKVVPVPRRCAVSGFGAGGTNVHLILEEYENKERSVGESQGKQLIVLSAKSEESLRNLAVEMAEYAKKTRESLQDIAYSLQITREAMKKRIAFVVDSKENLADILMKYYENETVEGIFTGSITLRHVNNFKIDQEKLETAVHNRELEQLAELWTQGAKIEWNQISDKEVLHVVKLPFYPFKKEHYWLDDYSISSSEQQDNEIGEDEIEELLHRYQNGEIDYESVRKILGE